MALCGECHRDSPAGVHYCAHCGSAVGPEGDDEADRHLGATIAGKYFLQQRLGRGGMGDVYRALHLDLDRTVVVKLLRGTLGADPAVARRFQREARAASRLNHPNSIHVVDVGRAEDGTLFMVMEHVAGRTLDRVIAEDWPLPEARVVDLGAQVLAALAEAHAKGIIHRDLKPANVMVEARRTGDHAMVLDFGIAVLAGAGEADVRLTQHGMVYGTPAYMSPEQARGEELDARSDLYSVGVILYELLAGVLPFEAATPLALLAKHAGEPVPPLSARRPGLAVSPRLEAIVARALSKDREARPGSADELREALLACPVEPRLHAHARRDAPETTLLPTVGAAAPASPARVRPPPPAPPAVTEPAAAVPSGSALRSAAAEAGPGLASTQRVEPALARRTGGLAAGRRPWTAMAAALALAVPALALVRWERAPARPATPPAAAPAEIAPAADPAPRPADASPTPPPAPPPPGAAAGPGRRDPRTARRPAVRAVAGALGALPTPPSSSGDGLLVLEASPWAEVSVNGRQLGETPREVLVAAGTYAVSAAHPDMGRREARVRVAAGERRVWAASFEP